MRETKAQRAERLDAAQQLRELLTDPKTKHDRDGSPIVYTTVEHVSRSGMMRAITARIMHDNEPWNITYLVARALGEKVHPKHDGVVMGGCGMDMGFALVYNLSMRLYCYAADGKLEGYDHDKAYFLTQRWM